MTEFSATVLVSCLLLAAFCSSATASWGSSSRQADLEESMAEFKEIVEDTEHIKEEFEEAHYEDLFTEEDLKKMDHDELAFTWLTAHDTDDSGALDGLEILKAVLHSKAHRRLEQLGPPAGYADETGSQDRDLSPTVEELEVTTVFVDELLNQYDSNSDGFLDFAEFMASFEHNRDALSR